MPPLASASLLDDHEFVAELDRLETLPTETTPLRTETIPPSVRERTFDELDEGLPLECDRWLLRTSEPAWIRTPPRRRRAIGRSEHQIGWLIRALMLFGVGGAGAALLFHDRVAGILALFR